MSLRLGVLCAVFDEAGDLLLSRRGDLNTWALPGGRLDVGERLEAAAAREVNEETGVSTQIERAVGLIYYADWQRMNVLYTASPRGGKLQSATRETRANRYFPRTALPPNVVGVAEALAGVRPPPRVIRSTRAEMLRLRLRFGWRWLINRISGHPEPKFPLFHTRAVAVVLGEDSRRVLTQPGPRSNILDSAIGSRMLPRIVCDGIAAPWEQLAGYIHQFSGVTPDLRWVGLWEDAERGMFEFVFTASVPEIDLPGSFQWTMSRNAAFSDRDLSYVEQVKAMADDDPVWTLLGRAEPAQILFGYKGVQA